MRPGLIQQSAQPNENAAYTEEMYDHVGNGAFPAPQGLSRAEQAQEQGDDSDDPDFTEENIRAGRRPTQPRAQVQASEVNQAGSSTGFTTNTFSARLQPVHPVGPSSSRLQTLMGPHRHSIPPLTASTMDVFSSPSAVSPPASQTVISYALSLPFSRIDPLCRPHREQSGLKAPYRRLAHLLPNIALQSERLQSGTMMTKPRTWI
ncbi:uncharacterized protein C8Q71DRAFT_374825 [Rhodofomes roseus]|uniref:Uncharacterized protein n=1 Tax=Rhodofomes roseus TaxID=34475 RepID=A0ABQ8K0V2_9APHY|nr:uncharacterized protein C8Q71DRAFT_374825 [Rhodofomes roseus]KAH9830311.1 hypothetical protein C8Q71DRAFT_374825 [Rhodofomes roseus]